MINVQSEYEHFYHELRSYLINYITLPEHDPSVMRRVILTLETLPHPTVASHEDIEHACVRVQEDILEVLPEENPFDHYRKEFNRLENLVAEAEENENLEETPSIRLDHIKLDQIADLLGELNDKTSATRREVGNVNESTMEMMSMLSTTQERVDQTLKSICLECGGDLRVYPHRGSDDDTALRLGCRDCDHEEYHVTSSFLVEEEEAAIVPVSSIGPVNADWWASEIKKEARTLRSIIFPYDGQAVAAMVFITLAALVLTALVYADMNLLWSVVGVGLSILGLLIGPTAWEVVRRLDDSYHNRYYDAALTVIDRVGDQNTYRLSEIAMQYLGKVDESEAEAVLDDCARELAEACQWEFFEE